jgi:predicted S18 family serine protease
MSKLQLLYKKQLAVLHDKLLYERKKYLVIREKELAEEASFMSGTSIAEQRVRANSQGDNLLNAIKSYSKPNNTVSMLILN